MACRTGCSHFDEQMCIDGTWFSANALLGQPDQVCHNKSPLDDCGGVMWANMEQLRNDSTIAIASQTEETWEWEESAENVTVQENETSVVNGTQVVTVVNSTVLLNTSGFVRHIRNVVQEVYVWRYMTAGVEDILVRGFPSHYWMHALVGAVNSSDEHTVFAYASFASSWSAAVQPGDFMCGLGGNISVWPHDQSGTTSTSTSCRTAQWLQATEAVDTLQGTLPSDFSDRSHLGLVALHAPVDAYGGSSDSGSLLAVPAFGYGELPLDDALFELSMYFSDPVLVQPLCPPVCPTEVRIASNYKTGGNFQCVACDSSISYCFTPCCIGAMVGLRKCDAVVFHVNGCFGIGKHVLGVFGPRRRVLLSSLP